MLDDSCISLVLMSFLCTVNGQTSRYGPTDRQTKQLICRSIYFCIYYCRIVCTSGFEKAVLHLVITPFKGQRRYVVSLFLSPPVLKSLELWNREFES